MEELLYIIFFLLYIGYQVYKAFTGSKKPKAPKPQGETPSLEDIFKELTGEPKKVAKPAPDPIPQRRPEPKPYSNPAQQTHRKIEESVEAKALREIKQRKSLDTIPGLPSNLADHSSHIAERFIEKPVEEQVESLGLDFDFNEMKKAIIYSEIIKPKYF